MLCFYDYENCDYGVPHVASRQFVEHRQRRVGVEFHAGLQRFVKTDEVRAVPIRAAFLAVGSDEGEHRHGDGHEIAEVLPRHRRVDGFELGVIAHVVGDYLGKFRIGDERILEVVPIDVGGDAVTGAATVILAMGAGKAGAKGIDEYLSK